MKRILITVAVLLMVLTASAAFADSALQAHFLDVGQGDAAIVICEGQTLVIDGGTPASSSLMFSYLRNTLGIEHIDHMIATHPHDDHIGGLAGALNACTVGAIYSPVKDYDSDAFRALKKYADKQGVEITVPVAGDVFAVGGALVQIFSDGSAYNTTNNQSIIARIEHGENSFLFMGDAEAAPEYDLTEGQWPIESDVLKVGHHGSDNASGQDFLRRVSPEYAVISVGAGNTYGHPAEAVVTRLQDAGAEVYRTDHHGHIVFSSDGKSLTVTTGKDHQDQQPEKGPEQSPMPEIDAPYIGNSNTRKYHRSTCSSVDDMKEEHKVPLMSVQEAEQNGYVGCKRCMK